MTKRELIKALAQYDDNEVVYLWEEGCCDSGWREAREVGMRNDNEKLVQSSGGIWAPRQVLVIE